ncbi:MAG: STAS domain-containing protein [Myxococcota bacterium]
MRVEVDIKETNVLVTIQGSIDLFSSGALKKELSGLLEKGHNDFLFNLEGVDFVDSSGLGVLVGTFKQVRVGKGDVALANLRPAVKKIFELTRLDQVFSIYESVEDALAKAA